jgi:hypothetical protein
MGTLACARAHLFLSPILFCYLSCEANSQSLLQLLHCEPVGVPSDFGGLPCRRRTYTTKSCSSANLSFPMIRVGLVEADVGQNAAGELASNVIDRVRTVVEGWDQGKDCGSGVGGPVHVADVNLV